MTHNDALQARQLLPVLAVYFLLWAWLPALLADSYPLDVVEGIYWGREAQWGYYKHPPLSSWLLAGAHALLGRSGPYVLGQLCVALTLWLVYRLGCRMMAPPRAALGSVLLLAVFYYTWPSLEFNHNLAQLPVWAGIILALWRALEGGRWPHWLCFGLLAGAGVLVKYSTGLLLLVAVLYSLCTPQRRRWLAPGPWLAVVAAALVLAPHLYWLVSSDWLPFAYAEARAAEAESRSGGRSAALAFLAAQVLNHVPLLLILALTRSRLRLPENTVIQRQAWIFLLFMGLGPAILAVLLGLVLGVGLRDMWGMPMWNLSGLLLVAMAPSASWSRQWPRVCRGWRLWLVLVTALMAGYVGWGAAVRGKPARMHWPQATLSAAAEAEWRRHSRCRLDNVAGDYWLTGLVASRVADAPSVMISGPAAYSPWMSRERLQQRGSLLLWPASDAEPVVPLLAEAVASGSLSMTEGRWRLAWPDLPSRAPLAVQWRLYVPSHCVP